MTIQKQHAIVNDIDVVCCVNHSENKSKNIIILSAKDSITFFKEANEFHFYIGRLMEKIPVFMIEAIVAKTTDTGPWLEDLYIELYTDTAIYVILSETDNFRSIINQVLDKALELNMTEFLRASMCKDNKTFVLFKKETTNENILEDTIDKYAKTIEAGIKTFLRENKSDNVVLRFVLAMLTYCPLYFVGYKTESERINLPQYTIKNNTDLQLVTQLKIIPHQEGLIEVKASPEEYIYVLTKQHFGAIIRVSEEEFLMLTKEQIMNELAPPVQLRIETQSEQ